MAMVDPNLPQYVIDIARDEVSHAAFLTAFLPTVGVTPVNLDAFRTLPDTTGSFTPPAVPTTANPNPTTGTGTGTGTGASTGTGTQQATGRLTDLTNVNIDTSWYIKYRSSLNPDLGAIPPQLLTLRGRSLLPAAGTSAGVGTGFATPTAGPSCPASGSGVGTGTGTGTGTGSGTGSTAASATPDQMARAFSALLFGSMTEQMETSTYTSLGGKISSPYVQGVLGSIQPVEFAHYIAFQTALSRAAGFTSPDNVAFPDFRCRADAASVLPAPTFLVAGLPPVSAVRPIMTPLAGAVALATALMNANVFQGQPPAFAAQMMQLAAAADASSRG